MNANDTRAIFQSKKKFRVVIRDKFDDEEFDVTDLLAQLDPSEKDEKDIVNAINSETNQKLDVPVPEVESLSSQAYDAFRSGASFDSPHRCFNYTSDHFEPLTYYVDEIDYKFIEGFNQEHSFLRMRASDVEKVFQICEELVKDSFTNSPTLSQVLYCLGENAPPYEVTKAIHLHWLKRDKQNGSIIRWLEFPPDHCRIRDTHVQQFKSWNKFKNNMSHQDYIKAMFDLLQTMAEHRYRAEELLAEQERKQIQDEKFVREKQREIMSRLQETGTKLVCESPIGGHSAIPAPPSEDVTKATIPQPPSGPSFLKWCAKQNL